VGLGLFCGDRSACLHVVYDWSIVYHLGFPHTIPSIHADDLFWDSSFDALIAPGVPEIGYQSDQLSRIGKDAIGRSIGSIRRRAATLAACPANCHVSQAVSADHAEALVFSERTHRLHSRWTLSQGLP
jgi:hypothetical protein